MTAQLQAILQSSKIPYYLPDSHDFDKLLDSFSGVRKDKYPSIITRPQKPEDVATIVRHCVSNDFPIAVRGGGHDIFGRFSALHAVMIDVRDIKSVTVSLDRRSASVGGGALALDVSEALEEERLMAPVGTCGTVGHTGWSLIVGLGPYTNLYGLGVDQVIGARIVNARGELVDADERLLTGLRGGGGNFGIVVELVIKVYPFHKIQTCLLTYESTNISKTTISLLGNLENLLNETDSPPQLSIQPMITMTSGTHPTAMCSLVWTGSEEDEFEDWVHRISRLAPLHPASPTNLEESIQTTTPLDYVKFITEMYPKRAAGSSRSACTTKLTSEFVTELGSCIAEIPHDSTGGISIDMLRKCNPSFSSINASSSVCPFRSPITCVEIMGLAKDEESGKRAAAWAKRTSERLRSVEGASPIVYMALTPDDEVNLEEVYGDKYVTLKRLKEEYDPGNVFKVVVPKVH